MVHARDTLAVHVAQFWPTPHGATVPPFMCPAALRLRSRAHNCVPTDQRGDYMYTFDIVFVFLSLITHPSSQYAFVADLAAGGISPPEISLCTARVRVRRQYTLLSTGRHVRASPLMRPAALRLDHTRTAVCQPISEVAIRHSHIAAMSNQSTSSS